MLLQKSMFYFCDFNGTGTDSTARKKFANVSSEVGFRADSNDESWQGELEDPIG